MGVMGCVLFCGGLAAAQVTPADTTYRIRYHWTEAVGSAALFGGYFALRSLGPRQREGTAPSDGVVQWDPVAAAYSDLLGDPRSGLGFNVPVLTTVGIGLFAGMTDDSTRSGITHGLIVVEAVAVNAVTTEILKLIISRPRPYTSDEFQNAYPQAVVSTEVQASMTEEGHFSAWKSMPSGHTSMTAATLFSAATLLAMRGPQPMVSTTAYCVAGALTATTGYLRVQAGVHYPGDVAVGAMLGATIGVGIAGLHGVFVGGDQTHATSESVMGDREVSLLRLSGHW